MKTPLALLALVASAVLVTAAPQGPVASTLPHGVACGDVTQSSAVLWARSTTLGQVEFELSQMPDFSVKRSYFASVADAEVPAKVLLTQLRPGKQYYYRATTSAGDSEVGSFRTAQRPTANFGLRFGVTGDCRGDVLPLDGIKNVPERDLDFLVLLGDTIYADVESPVLPGVTQATSLAEFRQKHQEIATGLPGANYMAESRGSTPVYVSIDDHEVTNDFAGGAPPASDPRFDLNGAYINETNLFDNGLQAFTEYMPIRPQTYGATGDPRTANKRRLYRYRTFGRDAALIVLDARSFRDEPLPAANPLDPVSITNYLIAAFDPARTMLGRAQVEDLKADLTRAQNAGMTWKFVMIPEPIQNFGVLAASDRYEGYAAERAEVLGHIASAGITNVVFVAADVHGTLVNELTFQVGPGQPQLPTGAFEVTTGSISYDAPFGPTLVGLAAGLGFLTPADVALYDSLPLPAKETFIAGLIDQQIVPLGYDPLGLQSSNATLLQGGYLATHTYGWTEFAIDPQTSDLTVTTWGVEPTNPGMAPIVMSEFRVTAQ